MSKLSLLYLILTKHLKIINMNYGEEFKSYAKKCRNISVNMHDFT
jgi:hypothetical protein